jgi:FkbM family methyltransferase
MFVENNMTDNNRKSINVSQQAEKVVKLEKIYDELTRKLPTRAPIFLPTDKIPLDERISGIKRVATIYSDTLERVYRPKLKQLRKQYNDSKRCFIVGNGPSLNQTDLSMLKNEVTFTVNGFFLKMEELDWVPTFYVVEDHLVAEDRQQWINRLSGPIKLFPVYLAYCLDESEDTIFFNHQPRVSYPHGFDFSTDVSKISYAGCTVTFTCMQLAHYLGFKEIYLVGVDASYELPEDAVQSDNYNVDVLDMKSDDPNHFHPDYFGKGFRWHDPQVNKMIEAYEEARRVTEKGASQIYNATVGGKLEVFERVPFNCIFPNTIIPSTYPKLLIIDITLPGGGTATGELKKNLFFDWSTDRIIHLYSEGQAGVGVLLQSGEKQKLFNFDEALEIVRNFDPDVIIYRPVPDNSVLHQTAMDLIRTVDTSLITWIVDDWPARLEVENPEQFARFDQDLRQLLKQSKHRFSIGVAMSMSFEARYNVPFVPLANGVLEVDWPLRRKRTNPENKLCIRYAGALAENMTLHSILRIAKVVNKLSKSYPIRLEIKTKDIWYQKAKKYFSELQSTSFITRELTTEEYRAWLQDADILVIAYNFDANSVRYIRYSVANKMPECLASGVSLLAHGPQNVATIRYLSVLNCATIVDEPSDVALNVAIEKLASSPSLRVKLSEKARKIAFEKHNLIDLRKKLTMYIKDATRPDPVLSPGGEINYSRDAHARIDETMIIAQLCKDMGKDSIMIDVGAHHGSALSPFNKMNWSIFAFEPDPTNREYLIKHYGKAKNVVIDPRAVSDQVEKSRPFYSSKESSGISCLNPFRESHQEACRVSTTTLSDFCKEKNIKYVDFLKIDSEGHDLMVLKGFPWGSFLPNVILCEFENSKTIPLGYDFHEMARFLVDKGYMVLVSEWHPIIRYGIAHDWCRLATYPCELSTPDAWGNLIAFRQKPDMGKFAEIAGTLISLRQKDPIDKKHSVHDEQKEPKMNYNIPNVSTSSHPTSLKNTENIQTPLKKRLYRRFANYIVDHYPAIGRIGLFGVWSLRIFRRRLFGLGGLTFLLLAGSFAAAYFFKDFRWLFISGGGGMVLLLVGVLGVGYARYLFRSIREIQQNELKRQVRSAINDCQTRLEAQSEANVKQVHQELIQVIKESVKQTGKEVQILHDQVEVKAEKLAKGLKQNETRFEAQVEQVNQELNQVVKESVQQTGKELQVLREQLEDKAKEVANRLKQNETRSETMVQGMRETLIEIVKKSEKLVSDQVRQLNQNHVETKKSLDELHKESRQALEKNQKTLSTHIDITDKERQELREHLENKVVELAKGLEQSQTRS